MRPRDDHRAGTGAGAPLDHLVVGAGLSGLAYAWRRHRAGRRVLVLEQADGLVRTPPALVEAEAPYLERLIAAVPGAEPLASPTCGPLRVWTPGGLRPATLSAPRRLLRDPASLVAEVRRRLAGARTPGPDRIRVLPAGVGGLRGALIEALGGCVRFASEVRRVRPRDETRGGACAETRGDTLFAVEVALDMAPSDQARLLGSDVPHHADVLRAVPTVDATEVTVEVDPGVLPPISGFVRGADVRARIRAALFLSRLAPDRYASGRVAATYEAAEIRGVEERLGRITLTELGRALGRPVRGRLLGTRRIQQVRAEPGHRQRMAALAADLGGRGVKLLGAAALGEDLDRLAGAGVPVAGSLPEGVIVA